MRRKRTTDGLTVNAVAGTHVVLLGLDLAEAQRRGCLGFAIQREDHTEHERYWLSGTKTFKETDPGLGPGGRVSSRKHPFQSFQWADYSAKPEHDYTYTVIPLYGKPAKLEEGTGVGVRVTTETELGTPHSVFFNRGAVASPAGFRTRIPTRPAKRPSGGCHAGCSRGSWRSWAARTAAPSVSMARCTSSSGPPR